jgi:hypothetical protein
VSKYVKHLLNVPFFGKTGGARLSGCAVDPAPFLDRGHGGEVVVGSGDVAIAATC